jgi:hypothetical protein
MHGSASITKKGLCWQKGCGGGLQIVLAMIGSIQGPNAWLRDRTNQYDFSTILLKSLWLAVLGRNYMSSEYRQGETHRRFQKHPSLLVIRK